MTSERETSAFVAMARHSGQKPVENSGVCLEFAI